MAVLADRTLDDGSGVTSWAFWLSSWSWVPGYVLVPTVLLLILPDGRPYGRFGGALVAVAAVGTGLVTLAWAITPYDQQDYPLPERYAHLTNPVGVDGVGVLLPVSLLAVVVGMVAGLTTLALRLAHLARPRARAGLLGARGRAAHRAAAGRGVRGPRRERRAHRGRDAAAAARDHLVVGAAPALGPRPGRQQDPRPGHPRRRRPWSSARCCRCPLPSLRRSRWSSRCRCSVRCSTWSTGSCTTTRPSRPRRCTGSASRSGRPPRRTRRSRTCSPWSRARSAPSTPRSGWPTAAPCATANRRGDLVTVPLVHHQVPVGELAVAVPPGGLGARGEAAAHRPGPARRGRRARGRAPGRGAAVPRAGRRRPRGGAPADPQRPARRPRPAAGRHRAAARERRRAGPRRPRPRRAGARTRDRLPARRGRRRPPDRRRPAARRTRRARPRAGGARAGRPARRARPLGRRWRPTAT